MGGIFNTPNTMRLLETLNLMFQKAAFHASAANAGLVNDLADAKNVPSRIFAERYGLLLGNATYDEKWMRWLDIFDSKGGGASRKAMAGALTSTARYSGIEFFAIPAKSFKVLKTFNFPDQETGLNSLIVSVETPTFDILFEQSKKRSKKRAARKSAARKR
jgi:hypothetical protein